MAATNYSSGYIERNGGRYEGRANIEGVDLSPIEGVYFKEDDGQYLWLKRKPLLEYDMVEERYVRRAREPLWEAYLKKKSDGQIAYEGECIFLHFKYRIVGMWDRNLVKEKARLNIYFERVPMNEQNIINSINTRFRNQ